VPPKKKVKRLGPPDDENFLCYSIGCEYWLDLVWERSKIYVLLYRLKDRDAWAGRQAYTKPHMKFQEGDWVIYRDDGFRDFDAKVVSKAEFETFKVFEKMGKE